MSGSTWLCVLEFGEWGIVKCGLFMKIGILCKFCEFKAFYQGIACTIKNIYDTILIKTVRA